MSVSRCIASGRLFSNRFPPRATAGLILVLNGPRDIPYLQDTHLQPAIVLQDAALCRAFSSGTNAPIPPNVTRSRRRFPATSEKSDSPAISTPRSIACCAISRAPLTPGQPPHANASTGNKPQSAVAVSRCSYFSDKPAWTPKPCSR
ncbi:hypothetical protein LX32DRAFT_315923 [Colletotrichum zoysiae]|uniref:Uncharacterized protein n=1 Tax=Colletotrichum zoysiae TaxID=1216348 RepID=A0AAD9H1U5_9PEZI|nr:hypothetical protein LX32DRAFT_315923 [Colletotrichum zoysiae]